MKSVGKVLAGVALVAALICIARIVMYGVGSLPFMESFNPSRTNAGSNTKPSHATPEENASRPSAQPNPPAEPLRSPPPPSSGGRTSTVPNPPSMYERARRAGNRPNNAQDE